MPGSPPATNADGIIQHVSGKENKNLSFCQDPPLSNHLLETHERNKLGHIMPLPVMSTVYRMTQEAIPRILPKFLNIGKVILTNQFYAVGERLN